jgi:streptomycin 6-kinase
VAEAAHVNDLPLPKNLADSIADSPDPQRRAWLDRLPGTVGSLARSWELDLGAPFQPGGQCSWVAPVRTADGARLVLKVEWLHPEAEREAAALRFWDGNGAVRVHADEILGDTVALLLERCEPGTLLGELAEPEQDEVVCALLPRLWREPAAGQEFSSLQAMCADWADEAEEASGRPVGGAARIGLDRGLMRAGLELFRTLPASAGRQVLLATDLHAENILAARREPWLVIDPKPHVGDPAYDPLQHMLNCDRLFTDPFGLARRLADLLDLDRDRLLLWLFARVVQESPGCAELGELAMRLAPKLSL